MPADEPMGTRLPREPGGLPLVVAVYGTLRTGERNHYLLHGAEPLGTAWIHGDLFAVPTAPYRPYSYPALVMPGAGRVSVELYRLTDRAMLDALDRLELYLPGRDADSQYLRRMVPVVEHEPVPGASPVTTAATYLYNGPAADLGDLIESGTWISER
ncbi:MAG TPA: gamma-glutamylcyclotransferase family protein [Actinomycetes bacterium]|nr:gamma-glutamylcyclotransferase family protein [Actinomycetes bacterium]